jgi:zinc/manganese transport system substrate-binding protein
MQKALRVVAIGLALGLSACGSAVTGSSGGGRLQVVAAENFWGSIATQLGGGKVDVTTIVSNPNADPHDYESSTADARAVAGADYVILNGAGYDDWGKKLIAANPNANRHVLTVANLLRKRAGDNPHFWYNPRWVDQVAAKITADYQAIDATDSRYFAQQLAVFQRALAPYHERIAEIRSNFGGVAVGATESIFVYMAQALGLNLISPAGFMQAVAEGNDPPAQMVAEFHDQVAHKEIKVLVFNLQTASDVTDGLKKLAADEGIPVVGITETLQPAGATFEEWQNAQLLRLQNALDAQRQSGNR